MKKYMHKNPTGEQYRKMKKYCATSAECLLQKEKTLKVN